MAGEKQPIERINAFEVISPHLERVRQLGFEAKIEDRRMLAALLSRGTHSMDEVKEIIRTAQRDNKPVREILKATLPEVELEEVWALASSLQFVNLDDMPRLTPGLVHVVPRDLALKLRAIPCYVEDLPSEPGGGRRRALWVALADPGQYAAAEQMLAPLMPEKGFAELHLVGAPSASVNRILDSRFRDALPAGTLEFEVEEQAQENVEDLDVSSDDGPARQLFAAIFTDAVQQGATDVHIEQTGTGGLTARYRIDGTLIHAHEIPPQYRASFLSSLKLTLEMDSTKRHEPQSGRMTVQLDGRKIDLRGETLPSVDGETIVARLLDQERINLDIDNLGFSTPNLERFRSQYREPQGAILVTGGTGSGKSTTLYAALNDLAGESVKVITIEDPVEYRIPGIVQVEVKEQQGMSFQSALRAALRCDPDIILVGEIRDEETGKIAMRAAQTGHLMLTTLHTNEAASAPGILIQMGITPFAVADAINAVVAQRLLRRVCEHCRESYVPDPSELQPFGYSEQQASQIRDMIAAGQYTVYRARRQGCNNCRYGYNGRMAVHEVLVIGEQERELILSPGLTADALERVAVSQGMVPLRHDALQRFMQGLTTLDEIERVIGMVTKGLPSGG